MHALAHNSMQYSVIYKLASWLAGWLCLSNNNNRRVVKTCLAIVVHRDICPSQVILYVFISTILIASAEMK